MTLASSNGCSCVSSGEAQFSLSDSGFFKWVQLCLLSGSSFAKSRYYSGRLAGSILPGGKREDERGEKRASDQTPAQAGDMGSVAAFPIARLLLLATIRGEASRMAGPTTTTPPIWTDLVELALELAGKQT